MKENKLLKIKMIIDYMAVVGVFYILAYQIKILREIGKAVCRYLINWLGYSDMAMLKKIYMAGEHIFRVFIVIAILSSIAKIIIQYVHERKLKSMKRENRFEESLFKYLQDKTVPRVFLITGKWGSGKTYEVNNFFEKYYSCVNTKVYRVSCFGLSSRKELVNEINNVIEQADNSIYATTIKVLQYLHVIGEAINKFLKKTYEYNSLKEGSIFIFDDFERITSRPIIGESSKRLYKQSPFMLSNVRGGRDSIREFQDIKKELKSIDKSFSQVDDFITQHSLREDYDKYIAVIGLINELVETYGAKVIIVCNSDILGEKFVHDVLRSKLNCIEYKKVITPEVRVSVIDNILKSRICDDEYKQQCINSYVDLIKDDIEALMLEDRFNDLRLFGGLLEAFIDTALLFEKEALTKEFLNSLLNSILIMHVAYYNNSIEKVDLYVNGASIEFLIQLLGGPIDTSNLIRVNQNSEELKWVDVSVSGFWIFNLSKPENVADIFESWRSYKYSNLESRIIKGYNCLEEEPEYNFMHVLFYQKMQDKDDFGELDRDFYIRNALQSYDLKSVEVVEHILNITYCAFRGRIYQQFFECMFEVIEQECGYEPLKRNTFLHFEYKDYLEKRNKNNE